MTALVMVLVIFCVYGLVEIIRIDGMPDEQRREYGHGPKGQGR